MRLTRRSMLLSTVALATPLPAVALDTRPRFPACGCVNPYPNREFHDCLTHDKDGRRFDSYTGEEVAALEGKQVFVAGFDGEEAYCCAPGSFQPMPAGTLMVGWMSGYYEPEYDEKCLECNRRDWLYATTTDWYAMEGHAARSAPTGLIE